MSSFFKIYLTILFLIITNFSFSQVSQEWAARYSSTTNSIDGGKKVVLDNNNNIYVTGASFSDFVTIKYNSNGKQSWVRRYNGIGNATDIPNDMIIDSEGNVYVTGGSDFNIDQKDFVTIKYNSKGIEMWVARYPCTGSENFSTSIALDSLNNIYITGKNFTTFTTIKYNSAGIQQWLAQYPAPVYNDIPWAIAIDDSSNVYIAGEISGDCVTIKYNSTGIQQWVSLYTGLANRDDFANSIGLDSIGNIYVSGSSIENVLFYGGYLTIKYNQFGLQQWVRIYEGTGNFFDVPRAMKVSKSGNVYISGNSTEAGHGYDYTTIKYNTNGDTLWKASYHNGLNDIAFALELDISGNVYVTGESDGNGTGDDYATVKYDSLGQQQYVKRYDYSGQFGDVAQAIAVDKNGNVYVTGSSDRDYLTIKYSQLTGVITNLSEIPANYTLYQNHPNPFNPSTVISYAIGTSQLTVSNFISLKVYDVLGNEVKTLVNEKKNAGSYQVEFDGSNHASGIYFYRLEIDGNLIDTKRMILLK